MRASLARALRVFSGLNRSTDNDTAAGAIASAARTAVASMEALEGRQLLSTYYVNTSGSDSASGTVHRKCMEVHQSRQLAGTQGGDKVLFQGGQTFSGGLYVPSKECGTSTAPVTFSTYGSGRATINSGTKSGIDIAQGAGIDISNLNFVGSRSGSTVGIWIHMDFTNKNVSRINVKDVDVSNYGREGMRILIAGSGSTINNVRVERSSFHDNVYGGLKVTGHSVHNNKNYTIDHVKAYNNTGNGSTSSVTGNGIYLADVDGALINRCVSYNNGDKGAAPVGIWAGGRRTASPSSTARATTTTPSPRPTAAGLTSTGT
jgi:hypothetical protein